MTDLTPTTNPEVVFFDFDGTLVSKDTGYEFNKWLIKRSIVRYVIFFLSLPVAGLLVMPRFTRKFGLNIIFYIATAFQSRSLLALRGAFIKHFFGDLGAVAYSEGLNELKLYQCSGTTVVIMSGCPRWLLCGVAKAIGIRRAKIIGSEMSVKNNGLLLQRHCYAENKLAMAASEGISPKSFLAGYSDSRADVPVLKRCHKKVLVNVPDKKLEVIKSCLQEPIEVRAWS